MVLAIAVAIVSIWVMMAAGITAVWLTEDMRAVGLVIIPTAIVAGLLVLYFEWRAQLQRSTPAELDERVDWKEAA